jgi:hypothetical protein
MGGSGAGVQCATSEGRPEGLNDRLSLQWAQHQSAMGRLQTAQEEHQFNERAGYFRLLGICGLVLSSAFSRNLLRRVYYITRHLLVPPHPLVHEAGKPSFFDKLNRRLEDNTTNANALRVRAGSPQRVNPNDTGLIGQPEQGDSIKTAAAAVVNAAAVKNVDQLSGWVRQHLTLNPKQPKPDFNEFGLPNTPSPSPSP